jgi:transcriptional regulator with XRE-family HTH domain
MNDPDATQPADPAVSGGDGDRSAAGHLARNLAGLRHARQLTQDALARAAAVPRSTIANLESGAGNPSLVVLVKVAHALGVPSRFASRAAASRSAISSPSRFPTR